MAQNVNYVFLSVFLAVMFCNTCESIKCFSCNSANNSACLDVALGKIHNIVPVVDCGATLPNVASNEFFCRKMIQTIIYAERSPEVRVMRGCGWVKHKRACYKADNAGHLETVCQCFGDMCNAATTVTHVKLTALGTVTSLLAAYTRWRGSV